MAGITTKALNDEQYENMVNAFYDGIPGVIHSNERIALILQIEANTGLRCGDILALSLDKIVKDESGYRFDMIEQKTGKRRIYAVADELYRMLEDYTENYSIKPNEKLFTFKIRAVQKSVAIVSKYFGYDKISTHSFRKYFGTRLYIRSNHDIELVRRVYQHSSTAVTSRYLGISEKTIDDTLRNCVNLVR